jgi:hypothetical protein
MKWCTTVLFVSLMMSICLPAVGKERVKKNKEKITAVTSPVDDKAGHDAATELDFKRLTADATAEDLVLTVEFWTAWNEIPDPRDAKIHVYLGKPGARLFLPAGYHVSLQDDGTVRADAGTNGGSWIDDGKKRVFTAVEGAAAASLDGTTLTITIPWTALPYEDLWVRLCCLHVMEEVDEETGESVTRYRGGASNSVPSDDCPNDGKALAVSRPVP